MIRRNLLSLSLLLALAPLALAQGLTMPLTGLFSVETMFALGVEDLNDNADLIDDFIAEFNRLEVGQALQAAFGGSTGLDGELPVPGPLQDLDILDLIGQETWIGLALSNFNPLPSVTLLTRTSPVATGVLGDLIMDMANDDGVQALQEGSVTFYVLELDVADSPVNTVAFAQLGDLLMASSNPDTLRTSIRLANGSNEPSFASSDGYAATLGTLGGANFYSYLNLPQVAAALAPLGQGLGFDAAIARLAQALDTSGVTGSVLRVVADGLEGESVAVPNGSGSDLALYNLLTSGFAAGRDALQFVPQTALQVTNSYADISGWWAYLNDLVASVPDLGITSLDEALLMFGVDIRTSLIDWTGTRVATITTGSAEVVDPGIAPSNLLGESVFLIETLDPAAAQQGLTVLFSTVGTFASGFADPSGAGAPVAPTVSTVAGVQVTSYDVIQGVSLSFAVTDGYALIATSAEAMMVVLEAKAAGGNLSVGFTALEAQIPPEARSFTLTDTRATLEGTATQMSSQLQLTAGLAGASNLDFEAATTATERLEQYLLFVAARLGGSYSYGISQQGVIRTFSMTQVGW